MCLASIVLCYGNLIGISINYYLVGYYCEAATGGYPSAVNLCPRGYYCDGGTVSARENPCPAGKYGPELGQENESDCKDCPAGRNCETGTLLKLLTRELWKFGYWYIY